MHDDGGTRGTYQSQLISERLHDTTNFGLTEKKPFSHFSHESVDAYSNVFFYYVACINA